MKSWHCFCAHLSKKLASDLEVEVEVGLVLVDVEVDVGVLDVVVVDDPRPRDSASVGCAVVFGARYANPTRSVPRSKTDTTFLRNASPSRTALPANDWPTIAETQSGEDELFRPRLSESAVMLNTGVLASLPNDHPIVGTEAQGKVQYPSVQYLAPRTGANILATVAFGCTEDPSSALPIGQAAC